MSDKSISSGLSLPQWVKSKLGDRNDSEKQKYYSPPQDNTSLYYYRYPDPEPQMELKTDSADSSLQGAMKRSSTAPDSQFKTAAEAEESSVSSSIYSVAQNVFSGRLFGGYLSSSDKKDQETYKNRERRNSKSLPASPLNSPRIYRKNPYFTDPFLKVDDNFDSSKPLMYLSILAQRRSLEDLVGLPNPYSNENIAPPAHKVEGRGVPELVPKPSELREMNFWSPVSM